MQRNYCDFSLLVCQFLFCDTKPPKCCSSDKWESIRFFNQQFWMKENFIHALQFGHFLQKISFAEKFWPSKKKIFLINIKISSSTLCVWFKSPVKLDLPKTNSGLQTYPIFLCTNTHEFTGVNREFLQRHVFSLPNTCAQPWNDSTECCSLYDTLGKHT